MDFTIARRQMVDSQVRPNDVTNHKLITAMETTPREHFLPPELRDQAYVEREIEYAPGRTLLRARDFAKLLSAADPQPDDLVLNVICGSGYSTAILAQLSEMVVSLDHDETIAAMAQENLTSLGVNNAAVITGNPVDGAADQGPFDLILICGVIEQRPEKLLSQLKDDGRLATIFRTNGVSRGVIYRCTGGMVSCTEIFDAATRAVLETFEAERRFEF